MERRVLETAQHIEERASAHPEEGMFRSMNARLIDLLRLQIILEVMYEMAANKRPAKEKPSRGEQVFIGFMQSLGQHYADRYPVSRYAEEAHLTVRHFSTLIHQYTGQTPMQWIASYSISQAKNRNCFIIQNEVKNLKSTYYQIFFSCAQDDSNRKILIYRFAILL